MGDSAFHGLDEAGSAALSCRIVGEGVSDEMVIPFVEKNLGPYNAQKLPHFTAQERIGRGQDREKVLFHFVPMGNQGANAGAVFFPGTETPFPRGSGQIFPDKGDTVGDDFPALQGRLQDVVEVAGIGRIFCGQRFNPSM